jgi:cyclic 2,3-diphosphoglycerate synthetase
MNILALIDGEHYPPVIEDALNTIEGDVRAAVFLGGTEKIGSIEELTAHLKVPLYKGGQLEELVQSMILIRLWIFQMSQY